VSKDNVGMVMHSSPIEVYESLNCFGKKVEEQTAAENEQCKMLLTEYTFISVPYLLEWAADKVNAMFCVKESTDIPRAISTLIENNATQRAFLELGLGNFITTAQNNVPGWDQVYYVIEISTSADVNTLLSLPANILARSFLIEFNDWSNWGGPNKVEDDVALVKGKGIRTFAATRASTFGATVEDHLRIYHAGIQVTYTYNLDNAVTARHDVNIKNGIFPAR
jgi:hypothetical protein